MTSTAAAARRALERLSAEVPGAPPADLVVAPSSAQEAAAVLDAASAHGLAVLVWGGGTHQGYGHRVEPDVVLSTHCLTPDPEWSPEDLTVAVGAGYTVADLEALLATAGQTAVLLETPGTATVGGVVAAGLSGWRRLRYGPTRDRVLEVVVATGDGRVVRAGGRVVKNVTGYDLPRLATGSLGSLGVIVQVAFKLWPLPEAEATVAVPDAAAALRTAFRPLAVIEEDGNARVYLAGTAAEVEAQAEALGGEPHGGLAWPEPLPGALEFVVRVPAGETAAAVAELPTGWRYQAAHGVGEVRVAPLEPDAGALGRLRGWTEARGGALVTSRAPDAFSAEFDPWGTSPPSVTLQRRVKEAFDPVGVCNPGRLPGGI